MDKPEKIYAPISAKARQLDFGMVFSLSGKTDAIVDWMREHTNEKGYINMNMSPRRQPGKYGETHSVTLNTWRKKEEAGDDPGF